METGRYVRLHVYPSIQNTSSFVSRFAILASIQHPGLCQYLDAFQIDSSGFCVIAESGPEVSGALCPWNETLAFLKQSGCLLKEVNEVLTPRGKDGYKLCGFGHEFLTNSEIEVNDWIVKDRLSDFLDPAFRLNLSIRSDDEIEKWLNQTDCAECYEIWRSEICFVSMGADNTNKQFYVVDKHNGQVLMKTEGNLIAIPAINPRMIAAIKRNLLSYTRTKSFEIPTELTNAFTKRIRSALWCAILGVKEPYYQTITAENNDHSSDTKQIKMDVGRCHQYDPLLSSPEGHFKLTRVLKAWLHLNPELRYWQGLDSICATIIRLNYGNDSKALDCLNKLTRLLFKGFLCPSTVTVVIRSLLMRFHQMLTFFNPRVANQFRRLNFTPDLFVLPWILTLFTKIVLSIWDVILTAEANELMIVLICCAIVDQLSGSLAEVRDVNDCLGLFSKLPVLDVRSLIMRSYEMYGFLEKTVGVDNVEEWRSNESERINEGLIDFSKELHLCPKISSRGLKRLESTKQRPLELWELDQFKGSGDNVVLVRIGRMPGDKFAIKDYYDRVDFGLLHICVCCFEPDFAYSPALFVFL